MEADMLLRPHVPRPRPELTRYELLKTNIVHITD